MGNRSQRPLDQREAWGLGPQRQWGLGDKAGWRSLETGQIGDCRNGRACQGPGRPMRTCSPAATASGRWREKTSPRGPPSSPGRGRRLGGGGAEPRPRVRRRSPLCPPPSPVHLVTRPATPRPPTHLDTLQDTAAASGTPQGEGRRGGGSVREETREGTGKGGGMRESWLEERRWFD